MADLSIVNNFSSGSSPAQNLARLDYTQRLARETQHSDAGSSIPGRSADSIELSSQARALAALEQSQQAESNGDRPFRAELVARIRQQINNGTYETPEKLSVAAWKLANKLEHPC